MSPAKTPFSLGELLEQIIGVRECSLFTKFKLRSGDISYPDFGTIPDSKTEEKPSFLETFSA
jgi:hypothetical protein